MIIASFLKNVNEKENQGLEKSRPWYNRKKTKKQEEKRNEPDDIQRL